jgi:hypothetical protein
MTTTTTITIVTAAAPSATLDAPVAQKIANEAAEHVTRAIGAVWGQSTATVSIS